MVLRGYGRRAVGRLCRLDRHAVAELLQVRDDDALAWHEAAGDDVFVANQLTEHHRLLPRDRTLLSLLRDEHEVLATDPVDGDDRHGELRVVTPHDAGADVL